MRDLPYPHQDLYLTQIQTRKVSIELNNYQHTPPKLEKNIDQKTFDDYINFFTTEDGADILPYAYLNSSHLYNKLLENNTHYYLFNDEVSLIKRNSPQLTKHLSEIKELIEIGPGSNHAVQNKTIPILSCATNLKNYYALDHSIDYLNDAYKCVSDNIPKLNIFTVEANLLETNPIEINTHKTNKKAVMLLGSTLENFDFNKQKHIIQNIHNIINSNDLFILTVDTNQDEESLNLAYSSEHNIKFIMGGLYYLEKIAPNFMPYINSLEIKVAWNKNLNVVDTHFIAKNDFSFYFNGYGDIIIKKGQLLKGVKSRKPTTNNITSLLESSGFSIIDILSNSNKVKMFIATKNEIT